MPVTGFHSDWVTIRGHRILLACRASFPDDDMRFIATAAVWACDHNSKVARVVQVFYDDKSCFWNVEIASTNPKDKALEGTIMGALHAIFGHGNPQVEVKIVKKGNEGSEHYHHMEHLSIEAGVAVDRFKHSEQEYQATVKPPS